MGKKRKNRDGSKNRPAKLSKRKTKSSMKNMNIREDEYPELIEFVSFKLRTIRPILFNI